MKKLLILLALAGCVSSRDTVIPLLPDTRGCLTDSGLRTTNYPGRCEDFQYQLGRSDVYYSAWSKQDVLTASATWRVLFVDSDNGGFLINHKAVEGATDCMNHLILLGNLKALSHELGHVLDCMQGVDQKESALHIGWTRKGYCGVNTALTPNIACEGNGSFEGRANRPLYIMDSIMEIK